MAKLINYLVENQINPREITLCKGVNYFRSYFIKYILAKHFYVKFRVTEQRYYIVRDKPVFYGVKISQMDLIFIYFANIYSFTE
jgi:hypothetical protein